MRVLLAVSIVIVVSAVDIVGKGPLSHIWRKPSRAEVDALRAEGDLILRALDTYRDGHGRYPATLPDSVHTSHAARYGGWAYACGASCTRFTLSVGNYRDHAFEIHWRFDSKNWYVDS